MANFSTHMFGAAIAGVVVSSLFAATGLLPVAAVPAGVSTVALGGIFPDVDSDYSDSIELVFNLIGVAMGVPVLITLLPQYGLLLALGGMALTFAVIRYGIIEGFRILTVHRGVFHSVPMALAVSCLAAIIAARAMGADEVVSWSYAVLFLVGFLTHLVLDEAYSVDLANRRVKRSFGTAIKFFDKKQLGRFAALYAGLAVTMYLSPAIGPFLTALGEVEIRLFPSRAVAAALGL